MDRVTGHLRIGRDVHPRHDSQAQVVAPGMTGFRSAKSRGNGG